MAAPREDVQAAFLDSVTRLTRRVEIYEQDASTPWKPELWSGLLVDGSVIYDQARDERRTFEVTLHNPDGALKPQPGGLYYDKVFKFFYGIQLDQQPREPRVVVVEEFSSVGQALEFKTLLAQYGVRRVQIRPLATTYEEIAEFDIVVSISSDYPHKLALLNEAYAHGKSIWTCAPQCTAAQLPELILGAAGGLTTTSEALDVIPTTTTVHPLMLGWQQWSLAHPISFRKITSAKSGAVNIAGVSNSTNVLSPSILAVEGVGEKRWVHMQQAKFDEASFAGVASDARDACGAFLARAVSWLNTFVPLAHWEIQIGELIADSLADVDAKRLQVKVVGRDYVKRCLTELPVSTTFTKGTPIEEVIKTLALNCSIAKFSLPATGRTLERDMTWEGGTDRWEIMKELATGINHEIYFTQAGYLTMRTFRDPLTTPATLDLTVGSRGNLVSASTRANDTQIFNHVVVIGESSNSNVPAVWAEAKNTAVGSPTSIAELGTRTMRITSATIATTAQAQELANSMLKVAALEEFELDFSAILLPWIDVGEILEINDEDRWGPTRYLISNLSFPLDLNPMSGNGKRVTNVA